MNLTSTRRADEFSRLLDSDDRTDDPTTGPLLAVADALSAVPMVDGPRPEFRTALRQRLVAVATVQGVAQTETPIQRARAAGHTWKVQRRLTALAAGAAVVTGIAGVGLGASRSLPGQPFYGVKRATESAQLAATVGTEARGKRHLDFARTRLAEVTSLSGSSSALAPAGGSHLLAAPADTAGREKLIVETLHAMDIETRAGANDLFAAFRDSGSTEPLRALDRFTQQQYGDLRAVLTQLPVNAQPAARSSMALLAVIATDNVRSVSGSTTTTTPSTGRPSAKPTAPAGHRPSTAPSAPTQTSKPAHSSPPSSPGKTSGFPTQFPTQLPAPKVPAPALPTIPPLPSTIPLPTSLPTLPADLSGLLGH